MLDFKDTSTAFAGRTDAELRSAYRLFSMMNKRWLVSAGKVLLKFALFIRFPAGWIVRPTIFRQFCGGETIDACDAVMTRLAAGHVSSIPDYSAEGKAAEATYDHVTGQVSALIAKAKAEAHIPFAVFKPTGIVSATLLEKISNGGTLNEKEKSASERFEKRYRLLCEQAHAAGIPLMADAEEYCTQPAIDEIVLRMSRIFNTEKAIIYNTLQMYRTDRLSYLNSVISLAEAEGWQCGFKLVRGAYMEKERKRALRHGVPSPVFATKEETDASYNEALKVCIRHHRSVFICAGTHNEDSSQLLATLTDEAGLPRNTNRVWFSQLYGMSDHISFNLAKAGYNACKYVPYGPVRKVMPYLMRRAEENTSVAGQTGRELTLIRAELSRRKSG